MHCEERSSKSGGSHENGGEAELIVRWISEYGEKLRAAYKMPLKEIIAVITPFTAQVRVLRRQITKSGLSHENLTIGTLHTMQGAERPVVLFSPTYGSNHQGSVFFSRNPRLLNVAVSRAKDAFLVFGSMELFRRTDRATGILGKHLFSDVANELPPLKGYKPQYIDHARTLQVVNSLSGHREILRQVFERAQREILIVSPFIADRALQADGIPLLIQTAVARGVRVKIVADVGLNRNVVALRKNITTLKSAGAHVFLAKSRGIHSKVLCRDSDLIVSGSFNWLAAVREAGAYQRFEVSFVQEGQSAAGAISILEDELREIVGSSKVTPALVGNDG